MAQLSHVKSADFQTEVLNSKIPVLVDFFAVWCGPCMALAPELEKLADDLKGSVKIVKVNIDEEPDLAQAFNVSSIPTLYLFKGGKPLGSKPGLNPRAEIAKWIGGLI